jgi:hypothetical protein
MDKNLNFRCVAGDCSARIVELTIGVSIPPEKKWINEEDLGDPLCPVCDNKLSLNTNGY